MSDEPSSSDAPAFVPLMPAADLAPNAVKTFELAGQRILLCRAGDEFFALENRCSHTGALLTRGRIRGDCIVCPVHGARFQLRDGKHLTPPASSGLVTFALRIVAGQIEVLPVPIDPPGGKPDGRAFAL